MVKTYSFRKHMCGSPILVWDLLRRAKLRLGRGVHNRAIVKYILSLVPHAWHEHIRQVQTGKGYNSTVSNFTHGELKVMANDIKNVGRTEPSSEGPPEP